MSRIAFLLVPLCSSAFANVSEDAILALRLPLENRMQVLRSRGPETFGALEKLIDDKSQSLQVRWRAITAVGRLNPEKARPILEKALKSPEWFQRNAAVIAMEQGSRDRALKAAELLMEDSALVVRTAAVQVIGHLRGREKSDLLWKKLFASENFRNGQSLWIRRIIAETLAQMATPGSELKFKKMLEDSDPKLHPVAIFALEKITGNHFRSEGDLSELRSRWLSRLNNMTVTQ